MMGTGGAAVSLGEKPCVFAVRSIQLRGRFSARRVEEDFIINAIDFFHHDDLYSVQVIYGTSLG